MTKKNNVTEKETHPSFNLFPFVRTAYTVASIFSLIVLFIFSFSFFNFDLFNIKEIEAQFQQQQYPQPYPPPPLPPDIGLWMVYTFHNNNGFTFNIQVPPLWKVTYTDFGFNIQFPDNYNMIIKMVASGSIDSDTKKSIALNSQKGFSLISSQVRQNQDGPYVYNVYRDNTGKILIEILDDVSRGTLLIAQMYGDQIQHNNNDMISTTIANSAKLGECLICSTGSSSSTTGSSSSTTGSSSSITGSTDSTSLNTSPGNKLGSADSYNNFMDEKTGDKLGSADSYNNFMDEKTGDKLGSADSYNNFMDEKE